MAYVVITEYGTKKYYNDEGYLHRDDGPAVIWQDGPRECHVNGKRTGLTWYIDGSYATLVDNKFHREGGPTDQYPNGYLRWFERDEQIWPKL